MDFLPEVAGVLAGFFAGVLFPYKATVRLTPKTVLVAEAQEKYDADAHVHEWTIIKGDGLGWRCACDVLRSGEAIPPKAPREITNG